VPDLCFNGPRSGGRRTPTPAGNHRYTTTSNVTTIYTRAPPTPQMQQQRRGWMEIVGGGGGGEGWVGECRGAVSRDTEDRRRSSNTTDKGEQRPTQRRHSRRDQAWLVMEGYSCRAGMYDGRQRLGVIQGERKFCLLALSLCLSRSLAVSQSRSFAVSQSRSLAVSQSRALVLSQSRSLVSSQPRTLALCCLSRLAGDGDA
jgi:hypothetical protein